MQRQTEMRSGITLFNQGEKFAAVHVVVSGSIKLLEISKEGRERVVALHLPGELAGMEGWSHGHYPYTAITAGATRLCQLQWPCIQHATASSALLERLLRKTVAQLDSSQHIWMSLPAVQRVAAFLVRLIERAGVGCELPLTRTEIGSLLGLAEETVVRAMRTLQEHQQLSLQGKRLIYAVAPAA